MKKIITMSLYLAIITIYSANIFAGADQDIVNAAEQKALNATNGIIRSLTSDLSEFLKDFESVKYLDVQVEDSRLLKSSY